MKGIIIDENLSVLHEEQVQFDSALPEFRTHKGVIYNEKSKTVTAPTIMWVKALDILMDKLQISGADFGKVVAVSGSGQVFDIFEQYSESDDEGKIFYYNILIHSIATWNSLLAKRR